MKSRDSHLEPNSTNSRDPRFGPPVLTLGGSANALSIARSLGERGITVWMSLPEGRSELLSKHCSGRFCYPSKDRAAEYWEDLLLGEPQGLDGAILFPCDDDAVEFVARHRVDLRQRYRLDDSQSDMLLTMLDKQRTLELAREAGVGIPNFWMIQKADELEEILPTIVFPVIVKPIDSHLFQRIFGAGGRKFFVAENSTELRAGLEKAFSADLRVMIAEKIPGPDTLLGSYYTYVDSSGNELFSYTKKIIRRFPKNEGLATYHVSEWDDELAEAGRRFFDGLGYRGFGNVEFKRDLRDGKLKVIECNPRFTAAQELLVRAGLDTAFVVYSHLAGLPQPEAKRTQDGLRLWSPDQDFRAFLELRRLGELTLFGWIQSVMAEHVFPYFRWSDPWPSFHRATARLRTGLRKRDKKRSVAVSAGVRNVPSSEASTSTSNPDRSSDVPVTTEV